MGTGSQEARVGQPWTLHCCRALTEPPSSALHCGTRRTRRPPCDGPHALAHSLWGTGLRFEDAGAGVRHAPPVPPAEELERFAPPLPLCAGRLAGLHRHLQRAPVELLLQGAPCGFDGFHGVEPSFSAGEDPEAVGEFGQPRVDLPVERGEEVGGHHARVVLPRLGSEHHPHGLPAEDAHEPRPGARQVRLAVLPEANTVPQKARAWAFGPQPVEAHDAHVETLQLRPLQPPAEAAARHVVPQRLGLLVPHHRQAVGDAHDAEVEHAPPPPALRLHHGPQPDGGVARVSVHHEPGRLLLRP
mmetsp:Transcript_1492/g.4022  ORF Transcript_1492/g.4022 Transcript_1492/m.4022 type:complete len:301 (-) Transcript_1492:172-1074(-)